IQKDVTQIKGLSASGFVNATTPGQTGQAAPQQIASAAAPAAAAAKPAEAGTASSIAEFTTLNNELGFVDLHNHDVLPFTQANVRIKGAMGADFKLRVNGTEASAKQVGTKTIVADKQLQVWEFVGVNLRPGKNELEVAQVDPFGNVRGEEKIELIAPSKLGK